jgi:hypothetical protein
MPEDQSPQAAPVTVQLLDPAEGWYIVWGPTAAQPKRIQRIVSFALANDGITYVPLVVNQTTGAVNQAGVISTDYKIDHPLQFTRNPPTAWP